MANNKSRKVVGSLRRRGFWRREEQNARVAGFLFVVPPTNRVNALRFSHLKAFTFVSANAERPLQVTSRAAMNDARKVKRDDMVVYRPHQGPRECARRIAA